MPANACYLWQIRSGLVRTLTWDEEGCVVPLGFWGAGSLVGFALTRMEPFEIQCLATTEAEVLNPMSPIPNTTLLNYVRQQSELMRILHARGVERRLIQFLCWLADQFGQRAPDGLHLRLTITHQEIAESIGSSRVTVTRSLKQLENENKLKWSRHHQVIYWKTLNQIRADFPVLPAFSPSLYRAG
ncbi:Crp/Fnr family transcriptional regulator [Sphaerothrix gracilis]|uniref:Crp/Fnr family transcriptional regulator n=1 Tax=Sphaerothrix gracilis TaxID=3151835 RepID=UPI0031FC0C8E